jgi:hypothetical protein
MEITGAHHLINDEDGAAEHGDALHTEADSGLRCVEVTKYKPRTPPATTNERRT